MSKILEIKDLSKNYQTIKGEIKAIDNISFALNNEEVLCIVGSSGCGKSTLLNILAGLDNESSGEIKIKDGCTLGYMLQEDALFPWLNILDNSWGYFSKKSPRPYLISRLLTNSTFFLVFIFFI